LGFGRVDATGLSAAPLALDADVLTFARLLSLLRRIGGGPAAVKLHQERWC